MLIDSNYATQAALLQAKVDTLVPTLTNGATPAGRVLYFQLDDIINLAKLLQAYTDKDEYDVATGVSD